MNLKTGSQGEGDFPLKVEEAISSREEFPLTISFCSFMTGGREGRRVERALVNISNTFHFPLVIQRRAHEKGKKRKAFWNWNWNAFKLYFK